MYTYLLLVVFLNLFSGGEGKQLTCYVGIIHDGQTSVSEETSNNENMPGWVCATLYYRKTDPTNQQPIGDITIYGIFYVEPKTEGCVSIEQQLEPEFYHIKKCYCYTDLCNKPESLGRSVYALDEPKTLTCAVSTSLDEWELKTAPQNEYGYLMCFTYTARYTDGREPDTVTAYDMHNTGRHIRPDECFEPEKKADHWLTTCICAQDKCNVPAG